MSEAPERIWVDGDEAGLENFLCWSWQRGSWNKSKEGVGEVEYIRADLVSEPCVSIPEVHPDLNLAVWLERRREQIGPWANYIIAEVGKLESEIAHMRSVTTTNNQGINTCSIN